MFKTSPKPSPSVYGAALREMRAFGFDAPVKPQVREGEVGVPLLPDDLGDLSDRELMTLFNMLTQWSNYAAFLVTRAEVQEDDAEAKLKVMEAKYIVSNTERGERGIQRAGKERDVDPQVIEQRDEVLRAKALRKMMQTMFGNTERSTALASRELTRRVGLGSPQRTRSWTAP